MKRFIRVFSIIMAVLTMGLASLSLTACSKEDIRQIELEISVFDVDANEMVQETLTLDLYRHYAPETVDAILSYAEEGYYNDTFFYKNADGNSGNSNALFIGDYFYNEGVVTQNATKPTLKPEFERGAVKGSDLQNLAGSVGIWRSWYQNGSFTVSGSKTLSTGRSTWYMPTTSMSNYNGWFCIFAQFDFTSEAWILLNNLFETTDYCDAYMVYYTGTYDESKVDDDYGLDFHCVLKEDYNASEIENLFTPSGEQFSMYGAHEISVPIYQKNTLSQKQIGAKIISATVVK